MNDEHLFCTFRLGAALFGVDVLDVKEVNTETTLTPVPHAPPEVRGLVNLRGQIYLILDVHLLLGLKAAVVSPESRLVIFKSRVGESFGVLVDRIGDIITLTEEQIEGGETAAGLKDDLIAGVGKCDGELLVILRSGALLRTAEQALAHHEPEARARALQASEGSSTGGKRL